jgi:hypothetical protein
MKVLNYARFRQSAELIGLGVVESRLVHAVDVMLERGDRFVFLILLELIGGVAQGVLAALAQGLELHLLARLDDVEEVVLAAVAAGAAPACS